MKISLTLCHSLASLLIVKVIRGVAPGSNVAAVCSYQRLAMTGHYKTIMRYRTTKNENSLNLLSHTHTLSLVYNKWEGVDKLLQRRGITSVMWFSFLLEMNEFMQHYLEYPNFSHCLRLKPHSDHYRKLALLAITSPLCMYVVFFSFLFRCWSSCIMHACCTNYDAPRRNYIVLQLLSNAMETHQLSWETPQLSLI